MKKVIIPNESGLHARPASMVVNATKDYAGEVTLKKAGKAFNAKSIMSLMGMGLVKGEEVEILCEDSDVVNRVAEIIEGLTD